MKNLVLISAIALGFAGLSAMAVAAPATMSDSQLDRVAAGLTWNISQGNFAFNDLADANSSASSNNLCIAGNRNITQQSSDSTTYQSNFSGIEQGNSIRF